MKPLVFTILLLSSIAHLNAQPLSWLWAYSASGNIQAQGYDIKTDPSGNVYVLGTFNSALISIGSDIIVSTDSAQYTTDFFLVKYDPSGTALWSKAICTHGDQVNEPVMDTDAFGNVIVGGSFSGPLLILGGDTLRNADSLEAYAPFFLAKYNASGNVAWTVLGDSTIILTAIATDAAGSIYATGELIGTSATWGSDILVNAGYYNAVVGKYDSSGNAVWASRFG